MHNVLLLVLVLLARAQCTGWGREGVTPSSGLKTALRTQPPVRFSLGMAQKSRGIVAIYGWMLASPKHLNKFTDWWTARGFTPLTEAGKPDVLFLPMKKGREAGTRMANKLSELDKATNTDGSKPPVFFHVFSGQGAATLAHTLHQMSPQQRARVGGIVMDCVPAKMDIDSATLGFKSAFHARPWIGEILGPPFRLIFSGLGLINPNLSRWVREYHELLMSSCPRWQVFATKADKICPHELLTELVEQKRALGADVNYKLWETGTHVGLFREYQEEYSGLLETFVAKCEAEYEKEGAIAKQEEEGASQVGDAGKVS